MVYAFLAFIIVAASFVIWRYSFSQPAQPAPPASASSEAAGRSVKESDDQQSALDLLREFIKDNSCQNEEFDPSDESMKGVSFKFNGGQFIAHASPKNREFLIIYPNFYSVSADKVSLVSSFCDRNTGQLKFFKVSSSFDDEENRIILSLSYETMHITRPDIERVTDVCVLLANDVRQRLSEYIEKNGSEEQQNLYERELYLLKLSEAQRVSAFFPVEDDAVFTASSVIKHLFDEEKADTFLSLSVSDADGKALLVDTAVPHGSDIAAYNILTPFLDPTSSPDLVHITIKTTLCFYVFSLRPLSRTKDTLFLQLLASRQSLTADTKQMSDSAPCSHTVVVGIDLRTLTSLKSEFHYMLLDAQDKVNDGKENELTDEQRTILGLEDNANTYALYRARTLLAQERYYEVVALLEPVFKRQQTDFFGFDKRHTEMFFEAGYLIGLAYYRQQLFEKAYYYLELTNSVGAYRYSIAFIDNLYDSSDVRIFREANALNDVLMKQYKDSGEKEPNDDQVSFYEFLQRTRGMSYLKYGDLDEAENIFKDLLDSTTSHDFAEKRLEEIKSLRAKNQQPD